MPRLPHLLLFTVAATLVACDRAPPAPPAPPTPATQVAPAPVPSKPEPRPEPVIQLAPDWVSRVPDVAPKDVPATLRRADAALERGQLEQGNGPGPGALELYLAATVATPDDVRAARSTG